MARLYCTTHGRECESAVKRRQADIRREGESVLIVKGKLISGPWRCDSCNAELNEGATAYLYAAYPRDITEAMDEYGFEMERDYFKLTGEDRMALYGAAWPGGPIAHMLGRSRVTAGLPPKRGGAVGDRAVQAEAEHRRGIGAGLRRGGRRAGDIPDAGAPPDLRTAHRRGMPGMRPVDVCPYAGLPCLPAGGRPPSGRRLPLPAPDRERTRGSDDHPSG